jgi:dTDP-4-dehydrorhamnose 3,5-epimerase
LLIEPHVFEDARGFFFESFNEKVFVREAGLSAHFVQDNVSRSIKHVLRGLHYQIGNPQGKLVRVTAGETYDVAVDLRKSSPTFGQWVGSPVRADAGQSIWIPAGFAHGFLVLSDVAEAIYKVTDYWHPRAERRILWNDPDLDIRWPLAGQPILSQADLAANRFRNAELFE